MSCLTWPLRHNYLKCPLFEGTSQPRSLGALTRDVPMANTPTLASFVELASQNCFLFSSPTQSPLQPSLQKTNLMPATQLRWLGHSIASTATATSRPLSLVELALDVAMANTPTSASFVNRVVFDAGAFAKHSQRVLSQQPAATLLYQLHYVPAKPATFSFAELQRGLPSTSARFVGEDVFKQQAERFGSLGHSTASTATATSRPLSLVELALDVTMANTPTSASFVKRVVLDAGQSADLCDAAYGDTLLPLPRALQVLQCSCEHPHNDGQALHILRCTNLITFQDNQRGHTLCTQCRTLPDDVFHRSVQIMLLVQERVQERGIVLTPRIHFGAYRESITHRLDTAGIPHCRCVCASCDNPDNPRRDPVTEHDFDLVASAIADRDINDFVSGAVPTPRKPRSAPRRRKR
jgi:hypothetical protein